MRGTKAKSLRQIDKMLRELGLMEQPTKTLNIKKTPGPNRAERRMAKFQPNRYADLQHEQDPAAKRTLIRRWIYAYSPKLRELASKASPEVKIHKGSG